MSTKKKFLNFSGLVCKDSPKSPLFFLLSNDSLQSCLPLLLETSMLAVLFWTPSSLSPKQTVFSFLLPYPEIMFPESFLPQILQHQTYQQSTLSTINIQTTTLCTIAMCKRTEGRQEKMCFPWLSQHLNKAGFHSHIKGISAYGRCLSDTKPLQLWFFFLGKWQNIHTTIQKLRMRKGKTSKATFYFITILSFINWHTWWPLWYMVVGVLTAVGLLVIDHNSSFPKIRQKVNCYKGLHLWVIN